MNHLNIFTKSVSEDTFEVFYSMKKGICEGKLTVHMTDKRLPDGLETAAELAAITELVTKRGWNISETGNGMLIRYSCYDIQALLDQTSEMFYLAKYAHFITTEYADAKMEWCTNDKWLSVKSESYREDVLLVDGPIVRTEYCRFFQEEVLITRHAVTRAVERNSGLTSRAKAYRTLKKALDSNNLKELQPSVIRRMHNNLNYPKEARALYHVGTNFILILVPEDKGWAMTTCVQYIKTTSYINKPV